MDKRPTRESSPGETLDKMMKDRGWTQVDLANILGKPQPSISQIITGRKAVTPETACALAMAFGNEPSYWMELESRYRLSLIESSDPAVKERAQLYDIAPVKEMEKRGWIKKANTPDAIADDLRQFFGTDDLDAIPDLCVHTKKTHRISPLSPEQRAWCFRARNLASSLKVGRFTANKFNKGIKALRTLAAWPQETRKVSRVLAEMGIRFVVIEPLARTRIDGATFWIAENRPVIALSVRYDRIDSFWHSLGHELSHVNHCDGLVVDADLVGENRASPAELDSTERRADTEASDFIIEQSELDDFVVRVGPLYSRQRINQFANRIRVHPGIIVGQLQYRGELSYAQLRDTLVKVREHITSEALTDGWDHMITS